MGKIIISEERLARRSCPGPDRRGGLQARRLGRSVSAKLGTKGREEAAKVPARRGAGHRGHAAGVGAATSSSPRGGHPGSAPWRTG